MKKLTFDSLRFFGSHMCTFFTVALRETPSVVGASGSSAERKRKRMEELAGKQRAARKKLMRGAKQQQATPS
jgi:hypothetical protein